MMRVSHSNRAKPRPGHTADTTYICPKCQSTETSLMPRMVYDDWGLDRVQVWDRACLKCWHRWTPGEKP